MAELRKFLDQEGVGTLWGKIDKKFADAESTLAIFEAIGNELDELAAAQTGGVGKKTEEGGEIFNDYENNQAYSFAHAEGQLTYATSGAAHAEGYKTLAQQFASHAEGRGTYAKGEASHTEGSSTEALGACAHAEGTGTSAKTEGSHAEGRNTKAGETESGNKYAHAEGNGSMAYGEASHAEGENTLASGKCSHAEGGGCEATGEYSHAEGCNDGNTKVTASAIGAHAEGRGTTASADSAHAEGKGAKATAPTAHAEGYLTETAGNNSHAEGNHAFAGSSNAHAEGEYTEANAISSHAEGHNTRTEGFYNHAEGTYTLATGYGAHAEGRGDITKSVVASGQGSHAEGYKTEASGGFSHAEGEETIASGKNSHAEGGYSYKVSSGATEVYMTSYTFFDPEDIEHAIVSTIALGSGSHAEGLQTISYGYGAHSEGFKSKAIGSFSHAEGLNSVADGMGAHVEGFETRASAYAHAEGYLTSALGEASHAEGLSTFASGAYSHAEGLQTIASEEYQHVQGRYNLTGKYAMAIGNGTLSKRSNAMEVDWSGNAKFSGDVVAYNTSYSLSKIGSDYSLRNHAYTTTGHGLGSETLYGHVKLTDELDLMEWDNHNDLLNAKNGTAATPNTVLRVLKEARKPGLIKVRGTNTNISLPASVITPVPMTTVITYSEVYNAESNKTDKFEISDGTEGKDAPAGGIVCPVNGWVIASGYIYFNSTVNQARKGAYLMVWRMDSKTSEEACSQYIYEEKSSQGRATTGSSIIEVASGDIIYLGGRSNVDRICDAQSSTLNVHYIAKDY